MKKIISVLQKTTRHAGIGLVVFGLIVVAAPVAVYATQVEHKIEICHNNHIIEVDESGFENGHDGDFIITEENRSTCEKVKEQEGDAGTLKVVKVVQGSDAGVGSFSYVVSHGDSISSASPFETGGTSLEKDAGNYTVTEVNIPANYTVTYSSDAEGHLTNCADIPVSEEKTTTCTVTNTYHSPEEPKSCTFGSDTTTVVGEVPAVASFVHPAWTHALETSGIMWIWNAFHATPSDTTDEIVTFTKTFNVVGTPSSVKLDLAADNYYSVSVNGTASCSDTSNLDNFSSVEPQCDITSLVHTGVNTLTFVVTNKSGFGTNPETNPGGLIYKVTIDGASCSEVPPPVVVENSCVQPSTEGGPGHIAIGAATYYGEISVQQILNNAGYSSTNADTDQVNAQAWTDTGSTVSFSVKALSKNALDAHVFGYVLNGGSFVGVFRDATTSNVTYDALPLRNSADDGVTTFDLPNVTSVSFAILDVQSGKIYSTKKSANDDSMNHAVVYNPLSDTYVIGFEDVSGGDGDMNDLAVEVTVTGCHEPSDEETNTASTIVVKFPNLETETNVATAATNNSGKWFYYNDTTDQINNLLGSFVTGPASAPLGTGSSEMTDPDATGRIDIATFAFSGVKLADIKTLAFSSYSHSGISGPTESPYLVFNVSFDGTDTWQRRLVYVPANNGAVPQDVWNTNDTIQAGAGKWVYSGATWPVTGEPGTTAKTWTQILSDYPSAKVLPTGGLMGIRVGEPGPAGYTGNTDKFVIGIKTGSNIDTKTYDFEPSPVCSDGKDNDQDEAIDANDPGCHSDGNVENSESYTPNGTSEVNSVVIDTTPKPVCSDGTDNDGDGLTDASDPGCHSDGNVNNSGSYTPDGSSEVNQTITTFGGRSSSRRGGGGGGNVQGQVLGASCGLYMDKHLRYGSKKNDSEQVKKLQTFLNKWMGTSLTVSGIYDAKTLATLKNFQAKYSDDILKPWKIGAPTGLVYFTTLHKINELECPEAAGDKPSNLIDWSKNPKAQ